MRKKCVRWDSRGAPRLAADLALHWQRRGGGDACAWWLSWTKATRRTSLPSPHHACAPCTAAGAMATPPTRTVSMERRSTGTAPHACSSARCTRSPRKRSATSGGSRCSMSAWTSCSFCPSSCTWSFPGRSTSMPCEFSWAVGLMPCRNALGGRFKNAM
eukprot:365442-Chlamydomonas_euryale.AAC.5